MTTVAPANDPIASQIMSTFSAPAETPMAGKKVSFDFSDVASTVSGVPVQQGTGGAGYDAAKFGTPGFGEETPMVSYANLESAFKSRGVPVAETPRKMSFSAESQQLAHPEAAQVLMCSNLKFCYTPTETDEDEQVPHAAHDRAHLRADHRGAAADA